jgi:hypothetical protein
VAVDPKQNLGRLGARVFTPQMEASDAVPAQLRSLGLEPAQVGTVIMTHLHGRPRERDLRVPGVGLPGLEAGVGRRDHGLAPALHGYVRRHFDHAFDFRTVDFDADDVDSFATFGRSVDVFGDGSVRLVFTPGHTLGHMSVILRLKNQDVRRCGRRRLHAPRPGDRDTSRTAWRTSTCTSARSASSRSTPSRRRTR